MTTQNKDNPFLRAALRYAELGFRVFPVKPRGKEPLVKDWPNQATNDRKIIQEWWSKYSDANVAIVTGQYEHGFFCVLDFDPRNGGDWFYEADEQKLPPTCSVITGGGYLDEETGVFYHGRHFYYLTRELIPTKRLQDGVDLKGAGGYVVAPPSFHPNGNRYQWVEGEDLGLMPMNWLPSWAIYDAVGCDEAKGLWRMNPPIPEGYRHNYIVSLAGVLWNAGLNTEEIEKVLREVVKLFQTTAGFDTEVEISRLVSDLPKWNKRPKPLRSVLSSLPEQVANIVIMASPKAKETLHKPKNNLAQTQQATNTEEKQNEKKEKTPKSAKHDKIVSFLLNEKWVYWNSRLYVVRRGRLIGVENLSGYLYNALNIGKITREDVEAAIPAVLEKVDISEFNGIVLPEDKLLYAVVNGIEGLWGHYNRKIYCYPVSGAPLLVWPYEEAPEGVYARFGTMGSPIIPETILREGDKNIAALLLYMRTIGYRLKHDHKIVLSMFFPTLLGIANAGYFLIGKPSSGKSSFATGLAYLECGQPWATPKGQSYRDYVAVIAGFQKTTYFDEAHHSIKDIIDLLKIKITGGLAELRKLFRDEEVVRLTLTGSVVVSVTEIRDYIKEDFLDRIFFIRFDDKPGTAGEALNRFILENCVRARAGLIELFRRVAKEEAPKTVPSSIRFADWYRWGYRLARVLNVEKEYEKVVKFSKLEPMRNSEFGFLADFFMQEKVQEGHPYKLRDIFQQVREMDATASAELRRICAVLGRNPNDVTGINAIAKAAGYNVKIEKQIIDKQKGKRVFVLIFDQIKQMSLEEWQSEINEGYVEDIKMLSHLFSNPDEIIDMSVALKAKEKDVQDTQQYETVKNQQTANVKTTDGKDSDDDDDDNPDGNPTPEGGGDDGGGGGGGGEGNGGGVDPWDEGYEEEEDEFEVEDDDPWDDVEYQAKQGQAAVNEDPPASAIIYEGEKISMDDVKRYVKLILTDFLEDPPNKKDQAIQKLTEYIDIVNEKLKEEDLHTAMQYIQSQINTIKMIALLNGKKIDFAEPYIPPSPKEVPVKAQSAPAPAPPAPPPPKPPAPPITNHHSLESAPAPAPPAPPKPPPSPPPIQNQIPPPAPPAPPPEPPPKPASPRLNYQTDDDFLGFMYAQMKNIRRNGGGDNEVAAYLLGLREDVSEYLRQKGLNHALFILEATLKSFFVARRM